jgi:hypothetical protein
MCFHASIQHIFQTYLYLIKIECICTCDASIDMSMVTRSLDKNLRQINNNSNIRVYKSILICHNDIFELINYHWRSYVTYKGAAPLLLGCSYKFVFIYPNGDEAPVPSLLRPKLTINVAQSSPLNLLTQNCSFSLHFSSGFSLFRRGILSTSHVQLSDGVWPVRE